MAGTSRGRGVRWPEAAFAPRWRSRTAALTLPPACTHPGHPSSPGRTASTSDASPAAPPGVMAGQRRVDGAPLLPAGLDASISGQGPIRPYDLALSDPATGHQQRLPAPPGYPSSQRPPAGPAPNCRSSPATASSCPFTARRTRRWRHCRLPPVRAQYAPIWAACDVVGLDPTAAHNEGGYSRARADQHKSRCVTMSWTQRDDRSPNIYVRPGTGVIASSRTDHSVRGKLRMPRQRTGDRPERTARVAVGWSAGCTRGSRSVRSRWVCSLAAACRRAMRSRRETRRSRIRAAGAGSAAAPAWPVPGFTVARRMLMPYGARDGRCSSAGGGRMRSATSRSAGTREGRDW
jgi:hypothetical protein